MPETLITFPIYSGLPDPVKAAWGVFHPGREMRLFCVEPEECSCIDIYDPVSQFHIAICQGSPAECEKWVNRHFDLPREKHFSLEVTGYGHCFTLRSRRLIIIWLSVPSREEASLVFSVLAHECLHAAYAIMDGCGIEPDFANEEHTAYLIQFLMGCYLQSIGRLLPAE